MIVLSFLWHQKIFLIVTNNINYWFKLEDPQTMKRQKATHFSSFHTNSKLGSQLSLTRANLPLKDQDQSRNRCNLQSRR